MNMIATMMKSASKAFAVSLFFAALATAQQRAFDGTWQMDPAKSHVSDGRVATITIALVGDGIKLTMKTIKSDGKEATVEFTSKLDGKSCEATEGTHKTQFTMWYNGPTLNACKENGPADDVTSMWKFELSPDKQTMTMTINHFEPIADDETLVFNKKTS
jgi:hypothetical protein